MIMIIMAKMEYLHARSVLSASHELSHLILKGGFIIIFILCIRKPRYREAK